MPDPLISCIVPVHDGERFLGEALDSILAQSYRPLEVIVVDDGSTDGTADIAARRAPLVTFLRQDNRGAASAKNLGLSASRGELVAFLDADDLWLPGKLASQQAWIRERPDFTLCLTRFQNFWMPELAAEAARYRDEPVAQPLSAWQIGTLLTSRATFDRVGPFGEGLRGNENMLWFLRAAEAGATIEVLPEVLMRRRFHRGNDTRRGSAHMLDLFLPIVQAWRDLRHGRPGEETPDGS
ncbi:MAG TPA: glycosyltransferase family A protein [Gemmatimonadales bacterium]